MNAQRKLHFWCTLNKIGHLLSTNQVYFCCFAENDFAVYWIYLLSLLVFVNIGHTMHFWLWQNPIPFPDCDGIKLICFYRLFEGPKRPLWNFTAFPDFKNCEWILTIWIRQPFQLNQRQSCFLPVPVLQFMTREIVTRHYSLPACKEWGK